MADERGHSPIQINLLSPHPQQDDHRPLRSAADFYTALRATRINSANQPTFNLSEMSRSASLDQGSSSKKSPFRSSFKFSWKSFRSSKKTESSPRRRESPTEDFFIMESFPDTGYTPDELSVRICKDTIRSTLLESVYLVCGNSALLIEMESARPGSLGRTVFEPLTPVERNHVLLWAAFITRLDLLKTLHAAGGVDVNFSLPKQAGAGFTALHLSSFSGCANCVKWLIEKGADATAVKDIYTPLHYAVLGNSLSAARYLIQYAGCSISDTVLHAAVLANAADCIQLLVTHGASVDTYDQYGMTPLHLAADRSLSACLRILLEHRRTDVDAQTVRRRATALHLASENGHHRCVQLLVEKGVALETTNYRWQTALHLAAKAQSVECEDEVLKAGAEVNALDSDGRCPLHAAVCKPQLALPIVEMLIWWDGDVNVADRYGYSPLHVAALNELSQCVDCLVMNGANVGAKTKGGMTALSIMNRKTPTSVDTVKDKLDESLSVTEPEGASRELKLKLDFRYLLQSSTCGEIGFLQMLEQEGHRRILEHPLCVAFLHLKWEKVRMYYFSRLIFCTVYVTLLSVYVMTALAHDCYNATRNEVDDPAHATCKNHSFVGEKLMQHPRFMEYVWYALVSCTAIEVIRKLYSTPGFSSLRQYALNASNIIEWLVVVSAFAISCVYAGRTYPWQNHVGAFAVLSGWSILMLMVGQLPLFGTYVAMYTKVQKEFAKLLLAYSCLLIGFTISFCVVFRTEEAFSNPMIGLVKVLAMMTGELDVNNLLLNAAAAGQAHLLKLSAYVTFVLFLFFVTVVLINLLVGIAVHDIEGLHKTAGLAKLVRQTELIYFLELALFHGYLPGRIMDWLKLAVYVSPRAYRVVLHVRPLNPGEKRLPRDVMEAALSVARRSSKTRPWKKRSDYASSDGGGKQADYERCLVSEVRELQDVVKQLVEELKYNSRLRS